MPQFRAVVQGFGIHFVRGEGKGPKPLPLLFTHGWPGSFYEVSKILGPLTDPAAHGGDWGAIVTAKLAERFPQHVVGAHMNMVPIGPPPAEREPRNEAERAWLQQARAWQDDEAGYQ